MSTVHPITCCVTVTSNCHGTLQLFRNPQVVDRPLKLFIELPEGSSKLTVVIKELKEIEQ